MQLFAPFTLSMKKVELLAPAGSFISFIGAINAGADAVYLAGNKFGARAYAQNFDENELLDALNVAHLFGKKVYLTLNTLIKEKEFDELFDFIKPYYDLHLDGIIVQDLGVVNFINKNFNKLPIHASTQMSVSGVNAVKLLMNNNVSRIVPARELSLQEIKMIKDETGIEIETFVHGAMCYSYSGMCLFSSILGGRSGNRGRCAQPCRLTYNLKGQKECYPLSMKDMCTINIIDRLIECGIDSFKIEGRMKKPEYCAGVTSIYRKYIDKYYDGSFNGISNEDMKFLENLYIRSEKSEGYYFKHNGKDMITITSPGYSGADEYVLKTIYDEFIVKKPTLPIKLKAYFHENENAVIECIYNDINVRVSGDNVSKADNAPLDKERICKQLMKTGDTYFNIDRIEVDAGDNIFIPIKVLNELRREALNELERKIISWNIQ